MILGSAVLGIILLIMKRLSLLIIFALLFGLLPVAPAASYAAQAAVGDNIVRVHLNSYGAPASVTMAAAGSYTILDNGAGISGSFTVAASGGGIKVTAGGASYNLDGDIYIKAGSLAATNLLQINGGYRFAGDMRIINKGGGLKLINHVDIETYTMGVLPYEMSNSFPIEALKAQAVAVRSYAYFTMHSRIRTAFEQDLVNSTAHQVYYGYNPSYTVCIAAVNATKNILMKTTDGQLVYACYSASNGGMTESGIASGAAASNYAYLPVKEDPYDLAYALDSADYSGKVTIPKTLSASDLKSSGAQPYKMLRDKLNSSGVDTNSIPGDVSVKNIVLTNPRASGPDRQFTGANFVLAIPGRGDVTISFGPVSISGSSARYPFLNSVLGLGSKFTVLALLDSGSAWQLASARFGHGAGLSQVGAHRMASEGKNYKDILTFYFNLGSVTKLVTMPWDESGGTNPGAAGYTVKAVSKTGTVNTPGTTLNVRSGPATGNDVVSSLKDGTKVTITGQVTDWWRIDLGNGKSGFVNSAFVKLDPGSAGGGDDQAGTPVEKPAENTRTGTVNVPGTTLNVRSGPGTTYSIIGNFSHGTRITVSTENSAWYKLSYTGMTAYVSSAYVVLDAPAGQQNTGQQNTQARTVYVNTPGSTLNVRSGPGTGHAIIGSLKHGEKITVTDENSEWHKLTYSGKTGYISKAYTKEDSPGGASQQTRTVYVNVPGGTLNVRSGPGTTYSILGSLKHGESLVVTEENSSWFKITYAGGTAYVSRIYCTDEATSSSSSSSPVPGTGTVNAPTGLNVRDGAGMNFKIIGGLVHGMKVTITGKSGDWYKIKYGAGEAWVNSSYIVV